jgi:hypothetical protein
MSDETRFEASYSGISRLLKSPLITEALLKKAEEVKAHAEDISPVGIDPDTHPGRYKGAFHTRTGYNTRRSRVEAVVYNDAPEAVFVEYGTSTNDAHHTLLRALSVLRKT